MSNSVKSIGDDSPISSGEGSLSRVWGTFDHAKNNIIGLALTILIGFAVLYTALIYPLIMIFFPQVTGLMTPKEIWSALVPFLMAIFGVLIGKSIH